MAKGSRTRLTSSHVSSMSPRYGSFRLCACDGSNENCRYCFGTGRISAHFEKAKAGSSARRGKATSKIPNEKLVFLPPITSVKGPRGLIYQRSWKNMNWVEALTHPQIKQSTYKRHDLSLGGIGQETHLST